MRHQRTSIKWSALGGNDGLHDMGESRLGTDIWYYQKKQLASI